MEKKRFLLVSLVVLLSVLFLIASCATDNRLWGKVARINTVEAYDYYLIKYPNGRHVQQARSSRERILERQAWGRARQLDNADAYIEYLGKYPNGRHVQEAQKAKEVRLEQEAWERAKRVNNSAAYSEYLAEHPNGRHAQEAQKAKEAILEQEAWEKARQADNFAAYSEYVGLYPRGQHADEARKEIAKSYKLTDAEIAKVTELQQENPAEARKIEYIDKLIFTGANCLDDNANWINQSKGRHIYDMLKRYGSQTLAESMRRVVLIQIDRLKVLFLVVKLGVPGTQETLNSLLMRYGDKHMAEDFLNCGSPELHKGGVEWAKTHGYFIMPGGGSSRVHWGSF